MDQLLMEDMLTQAALFSIVDQNQLYLAPAGKEDSYLLMDGGYNQGNSNNMPCSRCGGAAAVPENAGHVIFSGDVTAMLEHCYKCEMDLYSYESLAQRGYGNEDLEVVGECSRQMNPPAPDEYTTKIGRLSAEERKEKINRYMKKKTERNFTKKIKYACRKTLADSRHRVRGRFAKNEEFGEAAIHNYEGEEEEEVMIKEEELMFNSSGILASDGGVNSFQYNYTLQSWM